MHTILLLRVSVLDSDCFCPLGSEQAAVKVSQPMHTILLLRVYVLDSDIFFVLCGEGWYELPHSRR